MVTKSTWGRFRHAPERLTALEVGAMIEQLSSVIELLERIYGARASLLVQGMLHDVCALQQLDHAIRVGKVGSGP